MKKTKLLIIVALVTCMVLNACGTSGPMEKNPPMSENYPMEPENPKDDVKSPDGSETYPGESSDAAQIGEDARGNAAYVSNPQAADADLEDQGEDINEFAVKLYQKLAEEEGNLIFSPYSIFQAFLMTYAGANAETKAEIAKTLDIDLDDGDMVHQWMNALNLRLTTRPEFADPEAQPLEFNVANALWAQQGEHFEQAFLDKLAANYDAGLKLVDFANAEDARQLINLWVAAQTNDKIKNLIPEGVLSEMTRLVITNAVYFKGAWQHQFDAQFTNRQSFTKLDGSQTETDMMHTAFNGSGFVSESYQAVRLPYEQSGFSMALIMPKGDFKAFENSLSEDVLDDVLKALSNQAMINLSMPKFKTESSFGLADTLKQLGMKSAFDKDSADFSGITGNKDLYISGVVHKAFIDVNEEGTEAAAATAAMMNTTSLPAESYELVFDHPFIYVIYDQMTGTIVFMGRVVAP